MERRRCSAGPAALAIVGVVNVLIGAILAFVRAVQLRKFAADAYVANLVGLAVVREMAAVMTAVVMAGRTGGAYAARIATMQANEEIDALQVIGIPVSDYTLLPATLSLVITMPFLYLYGCMVGMAGGFVVSIAMLNNHHRRIRASVAGCGLPEPVRVRLLEMHRLRRPDRGDELPHRAAGSALVAVEDYWAGSAMRRTGIGRRFGVLFQGAALWSVLTVGGNVALPMQMLTGLDAAAILRFVRIKLGLVVMANANDLLPSALSGGMHKRAGLARALALDLDILFLDEPSAGLDPITSSRLDELILNLRDGLGVTIVMVSHELPSLFAIADDGVFLDAQTRTAIAHGAPSALRATGRDPQVQTVMQRKRPMAHAEEGGPVP